MLICNPYEIVIEGITQTGKRFRPSDWAERLCGVLSSFDQGHRLSYHQWVRPILVDSVRCVTVDRKLEQISPEMFHFLMDFAHDNDLRILDCKSLLEEHEHLEQMTLSDAVKKNQDNKQKESTTKIENLTDLSPSVNNIPFQLRELAPTEINTAFAAFHLVYPNIVDITQFQEIVQIQQAEGYRLLGIFEENKHNAVAVCGFRICTNFAFGRYLNIDDLIIRDDVDHKNYGRQLLKTIQEIAQDAHCSDIQAHVQINSGTIRYLFEEAGFILTGQQFSFNKTEINF